LTLKGDGLSLAGVVGGDLLAPRAPYGNVVPGEEYQTEEGKGIKLALPQQLEIQ